MYADDCKLYKSIESPFDTFKLQADLDSLSRWSTENHIPLNIFKCKCMRFHRFRTKDPFVYNYNINGILLDEVDEIKDLGVIIDRKLEFSSYITKMVSKCLRNLGWIKRNTRLFTDTAAIKSLYNAYVRPHFLFASPIWSPYNDVDIKQIEKVQHIFMRYLDFKSDKKMTRFDHNYKEVSCQFNVFTISSTLKYFDIVYAYCIKNKLIKNQDICKRFSKRKNQFNVRDFRTYAEVATINDYNYFSVFPRVLRSWNTIPNEIRELKSIEQFKSALSSIIFTNYK